MPHFPHDSLRAEILPFDFTQGLTVKYITALADRVLDGTVRPSDYGFQSGSAGAGQIASCLSEFNTYFDPNSSGGGSPGSLCVRGGTRPSGDVPLCPPGAANDSPPRLP